MKIAVLWQRNRNVGLQQKWLGMSIPDDSYEEANHHKEALKMCGNDAQVVEWADDPMMTVKELRTGKYDLIFNTSSMEQVAILEGFGLPFAGSGIDIVSLDKVIRKEIVAYHGFNTPKFQVISDLSTDFNLNLSPPVIVKPARGRNSCGISEESIVSDGRGVLRQARKIVYNLDQDALVEEFIEGREVTVGIIGNRSLEIVGVLEIEYTDAPTNTFEHKQDHEIFHCPARLDDGLMSLVKDVAMKVFYALHARDYARIDMIIGRDSIPYFLEINTFPGLHFLTGEEKNLHSSYIGVMSARANMSPTELYGKILNIIKDRIKGSNRA